MALVAHGWAAPAAPDPEREPATEPVARFLEGLAALPGAEYVLAVDAGGDRVRGESGGPPGPAMALIDWARRVADVSHERRHDLEDLVLTTDTAFHLVRLVAPRPGNGLLWVTVRVDRARGNLAWSRRALAGLGAPGSVSGPRALGSGSSTPSGPSTPLGSPTPSGPTAGAGAGVSGSSAGPGTTTPWAPSSRRASSSPMPTLGPATGRAWPSVPAPAPTAGPDPVEPSPGRSWFTPSPTATEPSAPAPERPAKRPATPSSWFSPSSDPENAPDDPTAGPHTGSFPAAMPAPAGGAEPVVPAPRRDREDPDADPTHGRLPQRERGAALPGPRRETPGRDTPRPEGADMPASRRLPLTVRQTWWSGRERPDMPELGPPTGPNPIISVSEVPAARTSAEDPPAPEVPAPRVAGNLFAPVVVVPPPPSPVDDDTSEMPAPAPYPVITAPPLEVAHVGSSDAPEETRDAVPATTAAPADETADELPELPQRRPGSHLPAGLPATPRNVPTVRPAAAVAGTAAFTNEPSVLRRLIDGLRRLS
jgi:hypothetical protein